MEKLLQLARYLYLSIFPLPQLDMVHIVFVYLSGNGSGHVTSSWLDR